MGSGLPDPLEWNGLVSTAVGLTALGAVSDQNLGEGRKLNSQPIAALEEVDRFHKTCRLLFDDLVSSVKDLLLGQPFVQIMHEASYNVWNARQSEHVGHFVFADRDVLKFAFMLVKPLEDRMAKGPGYASVCQELAVDLKFPLLLLTGVYYPRDTATVERFHREPYLRRAWPHHLLKLDVPVDVVQKIHCSSPYRLDQDLEFSTDPSVDPWYCTKARFRVRRIMDIHDQVEVARIAKELVTYA